MTQTPDRDPMARTSIEILFTKIDRIDARLDNIEATLVSAVVILGRQSDTQTEHGAMLTEILRRLPEGETDQ
jgi:hypothetical protein